MLAHCAVFLGWAFGLPLAGQQPPAADVPINFSRDIRPLLADRCFVCHGPDEASNDSGLRLDTAATALGSLPSGEGHAVVPGDLAGSELWRRINSAEPWEKMPPPDSRLKLSADEIQLIGRWIVQGAALEQHWAYRPLPDQVPIPAVPPQYGDAGELDRFVLARLHEEGIQPAAPAEKWRWLRRVTFDLTGLPPAPEELQQFLADESDEAYPRVVDRLLASPHFGERMAVPWLDVVRYADSYGYQSDLLCNTWPYRDWVVAAFNANQPYDQFLTWQLAGDLLEDASSQQRLATAFNRLHRQTNEGGSIEQEWRTEYAADRVHTFGTAMLGLTLECARCHDHKFDPISQHEYYGLMAFFNSIPEWGTYNDSQRVPTPSILLPSADEQRMLDQLHSDLVRSRENLQLLRAEKATSMQHRRDSPSEPLEIHGLVGHFEMDSSNADGTLLVNSADPDKSGTTSSANRLVEGRHGLGLQFTGDDPAQFPGLVGRLEPWEPFTIAFWLKLPHDMKEGVVFHRQAGTDTGFHGTELSLHQGRLRLAMIRFWPGNALAVETAAVVPTGRWVHLAAVNHATGDATGLRLYVDGVPDAVILQDRLYKSPGTEGSGVTFGERFRSAGLKDAVIDDLRIYDRPLCDLQVAQLFDGQAFQQALQQAASPQLVEYYCDVMDGDVRRARQAVTETFAQLLRAQDPVVEVMVMQELPHPRPTHILHRGQYDAERNDANLVHRQVPSVLGDLVGGSGVDRLDLARWLVAPDHPLTARVAVNRIWSLFFHVGLVESSENFGLQGAAPSHPELLDWLAREFVNSGWNVKALCRKIVLSATYRQTSTADAEMWQRDPENRLLARGPSGRLSAEMVRDLVLAASGLLNRQMGGPPISPYQPEGLWTENNAMTPSYRQSVGEQLYRRSLYTVWKRTTPIPNMLAFDAPTREFCTARRSITSTPLQSLVLLNDIQFVEAMRVLAEREMENAHDDRQLIEQMFVRLAGRYPAPNEMQILCEVLDEQRELFAVQGENAAQLIRVGDRPVAEELDPSELAAATVLAQTILNLDATIWKR